MSIPYLTTSGPSDDIEVFSYFRNEFPVLPDPKGAIPFHLQGKPIPDMFNKHTDPIQVTVATTNQPTNPLPFTRFVGTFVRQINQPGFLSVNEDIYIQ
jgi:hypothetical protein